MMIAPTMAPGIEPIPPMTIVQTMNTDSMNVKDSGLTNCWKFANVRPAMPPHAPRARARRSAGTAPDRMVRLRGVTIAPPMPWTARATISRPLEGDRAAAADPAVRVVVIAGAGPGFCAGHDLREIRADSSEAAMRALFEGQRGSEGF